MTHFWRRISVTYLYFLPLFICLCWAVSCRKPILDGELLQFSYLTEDDEGKDKYVIDNKLTITFDTVFTSIGSITRHFMVHNTSNQEITIKSIFLAGGNQSFYSINVNGMSNKNHYFSNVTIPKKDSIFVFVKVNINPQNQNNPFLVTDSIVFLTDSQKQDVKLIAYGQDARYIVADKGPENLRYKVVAGENETVTWTKERPYVVYGWATVDSTGTLIIEPGTKVYFHNNSGLWAYRYSNLKVNGTLDEPVLFRGDRLESWFNDDYAQWSRIWINEGAEVSINYAIVTNAFVGIQVDPLVGADGIINVTPNIVKVNNSIIKNTSNSGVLSRFLNLEMTNCLIVNNGGCGLQLEGGQYTIKHLTIANYFWKASRKVPACYVSNKVSDALYKEVPPMETKADFSNCIIYGNLLTKEGKLESEVVVYKDKGAELEATFQNCLVRAKEDSPYFKNCVRNEEPMFKDQDKPNKEKLDFTLLPESPAIGKGKPDIGVPFDLLGNPRGDKPDMGAYQFVR
jgi:hypothetical protein